MTARRRKPARVAGSARRAPGAAPASAGPGVGAPASAAGPAANGAAPLSWGRPDVAALAAAVLGPFALYAATLPRTVVFEDDGLFLMAGVHLGVAHPPGYPIHTFIVHLFTRLPFGDPAVLGHLSSAVLGALACGAVYGCARLLRASPVPALTAAWLFGVSEQFWSQAIITEVYTLNALLFFAAYALVLLGARDPGRRWPLSCAAVAWGAGLANHWPLMVLATPGLALALLPVWRDVLHRLPRLLGLSLASAALPYAWMVWLSHQAPLISFYGPIDTWSDFWFFVSREGYSDVSPSAGWSDRGSFLAWFGRDLVQQSTLPGFALALVGLWTLARRKGAAGAAAAGSGVLALLGNSLVLMLLLDRDFDEFRLALFRAYPLICYGVAALWVAVGLQWLADRLPGWAGGLRAAGTSGLLPATRPARGSAVFAALAGAVLVLVSASASWQANDRSNDDFAEWYSEVMFDLLPQDAALFAHGDASAPLGYYHYVEERRPDIDLYNAYGLVFGNRLHDPLLPPEERARALDRFVGSTEGPVFLDLDADIRSEERVGRYYGFVMEVLDEVEPGTIQLSRHPRGEQYFLELLDRQPTDRWERSVRNGLLTHYSSYLGLVLLSGASTLLEPTEPLLPRTGDCYPCLTGLATTVLDNWNAGGAARAGRVAAWLGPGRGAARPSPQQGRVGHPPFLQGRLAELTGDAATAAARYRRSYALYPHPRNEAADALGRLGLRP